MTRKVLSIFLFAVSIILSLFIIAGCDKSSDSKETQAPSSDTSSEALADTTEDSAEASDEETSGSVVECEHKSVEWIIDVAATCQANGSRHKECSECKTTVETATIPAIAHTEQIVEGKAATCKEAGLTDGKICSVCQTVLVAQEAIETKAHTEVTLERVQPTCESEGLTEGKICSSCDTVLVAQEKTPKKNHSEAIVPGTPATCEEDGLTAGKICEVCKTVITAQEVIPATDHSESDWILDTPATLDAFGAKHKECTTCGKLIAEQEIPVLTDSHEHAGECWSVVKAASCSEEGLKEQLCVCGEVVDEATIPVTDHKEETIPSISPSCNKTGLTEGKKCSLCGEILVAQETVPTVAHTEETLPAKTPTCTEAGLTEGKKCSSCGLTLVEQTPIAKTEHTPKAVLGIKPTCSLGGTTDGKKCADCGTVLEPQVTLPPNGHSFENSICTVCGVNQDMGVWIVDGLGNPIKNIVVKVMKGDELVKMFPYNGEFLSLNLKSDTYRIELELSSLGENYIYDKDACVITPENPSLTIRIFKTADAVNGEILFVGYPIEKDYPSAFVSDGSYKVNLTPNDYTFFVFTPEAAATYSITYECESVLAIGYHGGPFFTQGSDLSDDSSDFARLDNGLSFNIYASNLGGSLVFSVKSTGATECILNIKNIGEVGTRPEDEPWTPYLEDEAIVNAQLSSKPEGEFTVIDLTDLSVTAVYNTSDGYYHLGDANGPVLYIDLTTNTQYIPSIQTICANQRMGTYIYDNSGKIAEKRSYNELFMQYGMPADSTEVEEPIRIPLTAKLAEAVKTFGNANDWWREGSTSNIFTAVHNTQPYNSEYAWLLYCGIYQ